MTIGFVAAAERDAKREALTHALMEYVLGHSEGHTVLIEPRFFASLMMQGVDLGNARSVSPMSEGASCDLLVSIGGDGTFLRAAKLVAGTKTAILGVNAGRLGFLASMQPEELMASWTPVLDGAYTEEMRTMLEVSEADPDGKETVIGEALNEISVLRRDTASMIEAMTYVDGEFMGNYVGDGVNIATPTGSTAYSMSVFGPITHPAAKVLLICPIASHSLNMRPLVLPDSVELSVEVSSRNGSFLLTIDGKGKPMRHHTPLRVRKSKKEIRVAHLRERYSYYATLRNKLMWGQDVRKFEM
ncbi:MAG: NAD(+)/NADH kinase [Porphyromonas sp.]|nr:NAD(+)/NADH kinase [Bacteroidales bacterium]MDY3100908.1 NAD(+)/NADH kinase [Porphyromonas sp.]